MLLASNGVVATIIGVTVATVGELHGFDYALALNYFRKFLRKGNRGDATHSTVKDSFGQDRQVRKPRTRSASGSHNGNHRNLDGVIPFDPTAVEDLTQAAYLIWHESQRGKDGDKPIRLDTISACFKAKQVVQKEARRIDKLRFDVRKLCERHTYSLPEVMELLPEEESKPVVRDVCQLLAAGYTQTEIAFRLDVNQSTISRVQRAIRQEREQAACVRDMLPVGNGYAETVEYPLSCRIVSRGVVVEPKAIASVYLSGAVGVKDDTLPVREDDIAFYSGDLARKISDIDGPDALDETACPILATAPRYTGGATDGRPVADLPDEYLDHPYARMVRRMPTMQGEGDGI